MRLIIQFLKPFLPWVFFVIILNFGQVITDLLLPNLMSRIVDKGIVSGNTGYIIKTGINMILISVVGIIAAGSGSLISSRIAAGLGRNLREKIFNHVTGFSETEFDKIGTSSLITRTTNDVQQIQTSTFQILRMVLRAPLMCIGGIIMAVQKDPGLTLIFLIFLPLTVGIVLIFNRYIIPFFKQMQKKLDGLNQVMRENIIGIRIIKAFNRIHFEKKRFSDANDELTDISIRINRMLALLNPIMILLMNGMVIIIVWAASLRIEEQSLLIGDMMAFIQYAYQIFMSLMMVTMIFIIFPRALASAERIQEVLNLDPKIKNYDNEIHPLRKGILEFDNVVFRYENAENPVLYNISFSASPGETVAIIGGTGSGKSTLLKLIPRLYDINSGNIRIDGEDIRYVNLESLRNIIGYIPQKNTLFHGSISENIRFGKEDASENEIKNACKTAQASDFIQHTAEGYQHVVSQGGTNLSGGQKQRLTIARALVKKPLIYLFDDSFSALDFKTGASLMNALKKETENAAVLIVAQRISSIMHADQIIVLENGRIAGMGKHEELLESNPVYQEIYHSQVS